MTRTASYFSGKVVWVTGASSGIGLAMVNQLLACGAKVAATSRSMGELGEHVHLLPVLGDVTHSDQMRSVLQTIESHWGGVDVAILNAGNCEYVDVKAFDVGVFERMIRINFLGAVYCVEAVLPFLRRSTAPHLVTMSSLSAYGGLPRAEAYGASKAAVSNFSQSLQIDLANEGIMVSNVSPGFVDTPLTRKNDFPMIAVQPVEQAADTILTQIAKRRYEIHFPLRFSLVMKLITSLPARWFVFLVKWMTKR